MHAARSPSIFYVHSLPITAQHILRHKRGDWRESLLSAAAIISWRQQVTRQFTVPCVSSSLTGLTDFPLSEPLSEAGLSLPTSAFHLAAQIPTEWLRSPDSEAAAALSGRKVVWRALLGKRIGQLTAQQGGNHEGTGSTPEMRRVGRLNDSAYDDWDTFLKVSAGRLGIDVKELQSKEEEAECEETKLASQLEILHVLRCLVGPLIESTILLDRVQWIREELHRLNVARPGKERADPEFDVEMINLFDQATGSGRNVALAVIPPRKRGAN